MKKLFGTDGIRGKAYEYPLDQRTIFNLGRVIGKNLKKESVFLIGIDTRESSPHLASYLFSGLKSLGVEPIFLGVLSTPALSWLTKIIENCEISVMISASHNPYQDNGLKFFSKEGTKLPDREEEIIENMLEKEKEKVINYPLPEPDKEIKKKYEKWVLSLFQKNFLENLKIVLDTANGSLAGFAQKIFKKFGAKIYSVGANPNGKNINKKVGSLYPKKAIEKLNKTKADLAICFDGDGDRVSFVLPPDKILDGDDLLYILALNFKEKGILKDGVVATSMSNLALEVALKKEKISLYRTNVGDKFVYEELKKKDLILGGEQSGHIILRNLSNTGDGLIVALNILKILKEKKFCFEPLKKYPQKIINYPVDEKKPLEEIPSYDNFIKDLKEVIGNGRFVIRYSGTEKVLRAMFEAEKEELIDLAEKKMEEFLRNNLKWK